MKQGVNALFLLVCFERDFVYTSKEGNWVSSLDEVGSCTLFEKCIISVFVTISVPAFLLGLEDVGLEIIGRYTLVDR